MTTKQNNFIKTIGELARNEYLSRDKWILPSVCIAQAILESGWNLKAKTLFGIKGAGLVASTSEYYNGHKVQIQASFKAYPNVSSSVVGYYDFLTKTPRYKLAICEPHYVKAVYALIFTTDGKPYATDPNYISKVISLIEKYNLTAYDSRDYIPLKDTDEIVAEVILGIWGNGASRKKALTDAGYDYSAIQKAVNQRLKGVKLW